MIARLQRLFVIERVFVKYGLEELFLRATPFRALRHVTLLSPTRWWYRDSRRHPRGARIRLALEELGPVFVKLGQMLSTRRDLLPADIGDELARLQDRVPPFDSTLARQTIEQALGKSVELLFSHFEAAPLASASIAQVHGAVLPDGAEVVVKVVRPGIARAIARDIEMMRWIAAVVVRIHPDGRRLRPREVVEEYRHTIEGELDLVREGTNATVLRNNFDGSDSLYVPMVHWEHTRQNVMVQERIEGIPIRDTRAMRLLGINMKRLAENGVEIFYTQVFDHNFFHADMHPGNIFVDRHHIDDPRYIAVDFGIVGSLTDEDQRYIGENMLAFFERDYRRVAQLHVDSGWVPRDTRVTDLEFAIRAVCDPIFEKPLAEISFGNVLMQLFRTARRFQMEVQPQLVLLQKTLLNIEGMGRELYPELDLWTTGKPYLRRWVVARNDPRRLLRRAFEQAPGLLRTLPELPMLLHDLADSQRRIAHEQLRGRTDAPSRGTHGGTSIAGGSLVIAAALLVAAATIADHAPAWWTWVIALGGLWLLYLGRDQRNVS